ncbi:MAG TPA: site-2 protease family protein [Dehalococcoidia bacterium]|nr:site-2 protease family protein [Dehalococcoidia bacterium]
MLLWNLGLLIDDPAAFFSLVVVVTLSLLIAITVHEFSHALMSDRLGDPTARRLGRLSLNPIKHLDPMGTLMLFLVGFGWGKPVPVNPHNFRIESRRGMALTGFAGPLSNLIVAALLGILVRLDVIAWHSPWSSLEPFYSWQASSVVADIVGYVILLNLILAVFNLIPIPPLDGFNVAIGILPRRQAYAWARMERYGPLILLMLIFLGYFTGFLWNFLIRAVDLFARLFVGQAL